MAWLADRETVLPFKEPKYGEKIRRSTDDTERDTTPAWWTHYTMTVPRRREVRLFEHQILLLDDLEDADPPMNWNKPYNYYW